MKIHFAALIGVDYDLDLAPYWTRYYLDRRFDSYTAILHRENGDIPAGIQADYRNAGFRVLCADGPFSIGCQRSVRLNNLADNLPPDDMLVTADADEFQSLKCDSPLDYRYFCNRYDILHGLHEDRYTLTLENCYSDPFSQYTLVEEYTGEHIKRIVTPFLDVNKSPELIRTKILAAKAGAPVEYKGSHCMKYVASNANIFYDCKVIHFAWRENVASKNALKPYFSMDNLKQLHGNRVPDNLVEVYNTVESLLHPVEDFFGKGEHEYAL